GIHQILVNPVKAVRVISVLDTEAVVNTAATQFKTTREVLKLPKGFLENGVNAPAFDSAGISHKEFIVVIETAREGKLHILKSHAIALGGVMMAGTQFALINGGSPKR